MESETDYYKYLSRSGKMVLLALQKDIKTWRDYEGPTYENYDDDEPPTKKLNEEEEIDFQRDQEQEEGCSAYEPVQSHRCEATESKLLIDVGNVLGLCAAETENSVINGEYSSFDYTTGNEEKKSDNDNSDIDNVLVSELCKKCEEFDNNAIQNDVQTYDIHAIDDVMGDV